jgi:hypothetical protein
MEKQQDSMTVRPILAVGLFPYSGEWTEKIATLQAGGTSSIDRVRYSTLNFRGNTFPLKNLEQLIRTSIHYKTVFL